jgi:hypothetical protein
LGDPSIPNLASHHVEQQPSTVTEFRNIRLLALGYLGMSMLSIFATVVLRNHASEVDSAVWTRGVIVALSAALTLVLAIRLARGSRGAYRRLRIISAVMVMVIAVIVAPPGTFPLWMKIEQSACGLLLIGVVIVFNGKRLRARFATN